MIHDLAFAELDAFTFHGILKLRVDVFVVEQACPYPELDGRDTEAGTRHVWFEQPDARAPAAYLRLLDEPDGRRVGRVVTHPDHRGQGLAAMLINHVILRYPGGFVLDAQSHLVDWYAARGFSPTGAEFLDDGIPHVPMARSASVDR